VGRARYKRRRFSQNYLVPDRYVGGLFAMNAARVPYFESKWRAHIKVPIEKAKMLDVGKELLRCVVPVCLCIVCVLYIAYRANCYCTLCICVLCIMNRVYCELCVVYCVLCSIALCIVLCCVL
jgi:hypothetical protein